MSWGGAKNFLIGNTFSEASSAVGIADGQLCFLHPTKEMISLHKEMVSNAQNSTHFYKKSIDSIPTQNQKKKMAQGRIQRCNVLLLVYFGKSRNEQY